MDEKTEQIRSTAASLVQLISLAADSATLGKAAETLKAWDHIEALLDPALRAAFLQATAQVRRALEKRREELARREVPVKAPRDITRTYISTAQAAQGLLDLETVPFEIEPGKIVNMPLSELLSQNAAALNTPEAGYILDAILIYIRDGIGLRVEESALFIDTTFDEFCEIAGAEGDRRGMIKAALEAGALEKIRAHMNRKGNLAVREETFISLFGKTTTGRPQNANLATREAVPLERLTGMTILVNKTLFNAVLNGQKGGGYDFFPPNLNAIIRESVDRAKLLLVGNVFPPELQYLARAGQEMARPQSRDSETFYRPAILQIVARYGAWKASAGPGRVMTVRYTDLSELGLLPKHTKNPARRKRDLECLAAILLGCHPAMGWTVDLSLPRMEMQIGRAGGGHPQITP